MITIDLLKKEDIDDLVTLENECFVIPWSKQSFEKELENNVAHYIVAKENDKLIGYMGIWHVMDEGHITNIAVHPNYRCKGIGTELIKNILDFCEKSKIKVAFLEVRKSNLPALNLYKKFGFEQIAIRKAYYSDNREDAIVMSLDLITHHQA